MNTEKVVVVTGAARGIGRATAARFLTEGYVVIGLDVFPLDQSIAMQSQLFHYYKCDVTDETAIKQLIGEVEQRFGRIDVLANIAGVVLVKPLTETSWEDFQRIVNVNIGGTFLLLKHVLPVMQKRKHGTVVNMASVSGHVGQIDHGLYGATKAAVIALCRGLAWEMAPYHIRINSVSPGSVDTPMLRGDIEIESRKSGLAFDQVKVKREEEQAFGRWADPAEIASAVYFLASDQASFITGTDLLVDCGWTAR